MEYCFEKTVGKSIKAISKFNGTRRPKTKLKAAYHPPTYLKWET